MCFPVGVGGRDPQVENPSLSHERYMLIGRSMVWGWWKHGVFWNPCVLIELNRTASGHKMRTFQVPVAPLWFTGEGSVRSQNGKR